MFQGVVTKKPNKTGFVFGNRKKCFQSDMGLLSMIWKTLPIWPAYLLFLSVDLTDCSTSHRSNTSTTQSKLWKQDNRTFARSPKLLNRFTFMLCIIAIESLIRVQTCFYHIQEVWTPSRPLFPVSWSNQIYTIFSLIHHHGIKRLASVRLGKPKLFYSNFLSYICKSQGSFEDNLIWALITSPDRHLRLQRFVRSSNVFNWDLEMGE
jgi:hypothetical protein